jgi:hypothetical protein
VKKAIMMALFTIFPLIGFAEGVSMTFREIPITNFTGNNKFEHRIIPYRFFNTMTIIVEDPDACGQKPINPRFTIENGKLLLNYDLTPSVQGAGSCMLITQFEISNLPHESLDVAFAGGDEPLTVVKLKKCDFYQPVSPDLYECLAPVIDPNSSQIKE